jgi:2-amino-4-hydroxy-6-hydroxymethyldihydropteridine diphosphokinase
MVGSSVIYVGFGSNQGDTLQILENVLTLVEQGGHLRDVSVSRFYGSRAVGPVRQADFVNGVFRARTGLSPQSTLDYLLFVEAVFGRLRLKRWGPRTLDLDLLLHGEVVMRAPRLILPHPELLSRGFVLAPLNELAPDLLHPLTGRSLAWHWEEWRAANPDADRQVWPLARDERAAGAAV